MRKGQFPLQNLPAWCMLNNIALDGLSAADVNARGLGLVAENKLENMHDDLPALLTVPKELVLSSARVEEYAKENKEFRRLLDVAGHQSSRGDILLFLLTQLVLSSPDYAGGQGAATAWTQYMKLLPAHVPVPTLWSASDLSFLRGTSLQFAVTAKLAALAKEFDHIRDATSDLPQWSALIEAGEITLSDWILVDALYRSRSLALPRSGEAMVPCLDLVNHASPATAGEKVARQEEITIDYGHDKSAAEMLFSYGFIDSDSNAKSLVLPVRPMEDDPLAKAKLYAFRSAPILKITDSETGVPQWEAPFIYLMCLNDEDGLHFKVLQENDGSQDLRMFWQDADITRDAESMETLIDGHELCQVFRLRAVTVALQMIRQQLDVLKDNSTQALNEGTHIVLVASRLRAIEQDLLERALKMVEQENNRLLEEESVKAYLTAMNDTQRDDADEEDFT
ncbi:hypothetical protein NPX13_g5595 [Xylaria arbuscula]|uniref:SET domain-containing protein n=1 Tax=Xylaria arbuscula TaxID=114810 RepID=A0A9W8TMJ8_9PEZI|nr:hypothetical protein NPX13_g5595 [Xylaria arbuscula]